jgi:membrane protein implicated in regulation of membrane protease activity
MDIGAILDFAWILWVALILVFVIIEIFTLDFTFLMLALGSVGGLVASLFQAPFWLEVIIAGVLAVLLLFLVRPPLLSALRRGGDETPSNVDALLGLSGVVSLAFVDGEGQVKLTNGDTWTSRVIPAALSIPLEKGDPITVVAIEGATAIVQPAARP